IKNTTNKQSYIQGTSPEYKSTDKQPKKTTRINKTFTITHPQLKTISKTQRFHRQKQSLTHIFFEIL
ncbi:hypothetical protein, partial [Klebsiella pneumoniae]|uniref:hypothetical protein n=1 Tax=Klebsiella pneumoniae TaxID=573 RepID=UPI001C533AC3